MAVFRLSWDELAPPSCQGGALAIGNFDGVHLGHQALLAELARRAGAVAGPAVALTFDPHPMALLRPEQFQPLLTTTPQRAELMRHYGTTHVIVLETSPALLQLSANDFFERVIRASLDARAMVEGPNFGFGHNREGDVRMLDTLCRTAGMTLTVVAPVVVGDRPVSSSRVRDALLRGDIRTASHFLGRSYRVTGVVGHGQHRGMSLGFPTANLEGIETLIPGNGVYAVRVQDDGRSWPGAANVGPNPTFGEETRKLEVHLIGFEGDLYGRKLDLGFVARLRDTRRFASKEDLAAQLRTDIAKARSILQGEPGV
jgi:riboflavin kinase/FMN adenylyltransferase